MRDIVPIGMKNKMFNELSRTQIIWDVLINIVFTIVPILIALLIFKRK